MAYKTFSFIKGKPDDEGNFGIENAVKYRLYEWIGKEDPEDLKGVEGGKEIYQNPANWQEISDQRLPEEIAIRGAMNHEGKPHELFTVITSSLDKFVNNKIPIAKETDKGFVYYLRFSGFMSVVTESTSLTKVPYNGVLYFEDSSPKSIKVSTTASLSGDDGEGIYLNVYVGESTTPRKAKIYSLGEDADVQLYSAKIDSCFLYTSPADYRRTTYIPIDCLTNGLNGGCVGPFATWADLYTDIDKISFYDKQFNFLSGLSLFEIREILNIAEGTETGYLTVEQVIRLANNTAAKYVIFSSVGGDPLDKVSVGGVWFPLFAYDTTSFVNGGNGREHILSVKAIADGVFFTSSPYSDNDLIKYTR